MRFLQVFLSLSNETHFRSIYLLGSLNPVLCVCSLPPPSLSPSSLSLILGRTDLFEEVPEASRIRVKLSSWPDVPPDLVVSWAL